MALVNCSTPNEEFRTFIENLVISKVNETMQDRPQSNIGDPGMYIIFVLLFYSCGIVVLMINYMNKSPSESEDYYLKYLEQARSSYEHSSNRGRGLNRLALQAFNAVNVIQNEEKITFVWYVSNLSVE